MAEFGEAIAALVEGFGPMYQHGHLSIENSVDVAMMDLQDCEVGIQLSADGRIWLCVNGTALIRFKPRRGNAPA